jgi:hypothetical protein
MLLVIGSNAAAERKTTVIDGVVQATRVADNYIELRIITYFY